MESENKESGTVLVILAIIVVALLAICGLAIDSWRGLIAARQAQQIVDVIVTTSVNQLRIPNCGNCYPSTPENWRRIKKAALAALVPNTISVFDDIAKDSIRRHKLKYNSGQKTFDDYNGDYNHDTAVAGNISLAVNRGVSCFINDERGIPIRKFYSLEGTKGRWCKVNTVRATLTVKDIPTSFANILGYKFISSIKVDAGAERNVPNTCGEDQCSSLGTVDQITGNFEPFPCT